MVDPNCDTIGLSDIGVLWVFVKKYNSAVLHSDLGMHCLTMWSDSRPPLLCCSNVYLMCSTMSSV